MSLVLSKSDILFSQRFLKASGFYPAQLDGLWGEKTDAATEAFDAETERIAIKYGKVDSRSEKQIATLQPRAQANARIFLQNLSDSGIEAKIISGTRTYAEQELLYKKGRFGNKGPKVTNARGGQSNHNFGIAWDIAIFKNGNYLPESPLYDTAGAVMTEGVEWGGNWKTFKDRPHYQLVTGLTTSKIRALFEEGRPYWL